MEKASSMSTSSTANNTIKSVSVTRSFYRRVLPESCTALSSADGQRIFESALTSRGLKSFFRLIEQFSTQSEPAYCGISTLVIILNALSIDPRQTWKGPWRWYEERMLNCCINLEDVKKSGITLKNFNCLAMCQGLLVEVHYVDEDVSINDFREAVKRACVVDGNIQEQAGKCESEKMIKKTDTEPLLVVSYTRQVLGQTGSGHFSPIAAYDAKSDSLLVLDTARFKYGAHWVALPMMFEAMQPIDPDTGRSRGYVLLKEDHEYDDDDEGTAATGSEFQNKLPISVLFRSRRNSNPIRQKYKEFLFSPTDYMNDNHNRNGNGNNDDIQKQVISWNQVVKFWTKDGTDPQYIWEMMQPQLSPIADEEPGLTQFILSILELLNAIIPSEPNFPFSGCCKGSDNFCRSNANRTIAMHPLQAICVVYLASQEKAARRNIVFKQKEQSQALPTSSSVIISDEVMEQLLDEATLVRYAIDISDEMD